MACCHTVFLILWFVTQFRKRKVGVSMAQYAFEHEHEHEQVESVAIPVADPVPLGMSALAFTTAVLGCFFAGFIVPSRGAGIRIAVSAALLYGGIFQFLAGMWGFTKAHTMARTSLSS